LRGVDPPFFRCPPLRRDLAAWLAKWSGKYPKLTGWVEENIDETLAFYRLPRQRHSISRPGWRRTALSRRSLVRRAKGVRLVRFAPDSPLEGDGFELPLGIQPEENCGFPGLAINPKPGRSLNLPGSASDVRYIHNGSFEKGGGWRRRLASHGLEAPLGPNLLNRMGRKLWMTGGGKLL